MKVNRYITGSLILIILSILIGLGLYTQLPNLIASHWNIQGQVDGYMPKFWGIFLMPIISAIILILMLILPKLDPLKNNVEEFRKHFDQFIFVLISFFFYLYILTLAWNLGYTFNIMQLLAPAFSVLFYSIGSLMEHSKQNWFIGIRTPWTLSDKKVWQKTHELGGKLFKIAAFVVLLGIFFPNLFFAFMMISVLSLVVFSLGYSYYIYTKEKK